MVGENNSTAKKKFGIVTFTLKSVYKGHFITLTLLQFLEL